MKRNKAILLLLLAFALSNSCKADDSPSSKVRPPVSEGSGGEVIVEDPDAPLKIGTYNIEGPSATKTNSIGYWPNRRDNVITTIRKADFDILGTQENSKEMLNDITGSLTQYKWIGSYRAAIASVNAIIYKHERFTLIECGHFYYSPTPDVDYTYDPDDIDKKDLNCIWAKFKDVKTGKTFFFFNTHFHAHYYSGEKGAIRDTLRCRDARLLKSRISSLAGDSYAFCTGDYNCSEAWYDNNTGKKLHDARPGYVELMKGGVLLDSRTLAEKSKNGFECSIPGWNVTGVSPHDSKYDHVFVSALASGKVTVTMYEVITDSYEMTHQGTTTSDGIKNGEKFFSNCSDHRPVTATIVFK